MFISVIIPVHNGRECLPRCLAALNQTLYEQWECIVVDDNSSDNSAEIARAASAVVVSLDRQLGPAAARNAGAQKANGDVLFFIDADVLVKPGTIGHVAATLKANPDIAACFGSYDDQPTEANFLSQYRNLQHHYVHQKANTEASTFWSGCGAVYKEVFMKMNGFSEIAFPRPSIEDIELGYRLRAAGYRIRLEKLLQVTHMKRWTPRQMVLTDVRDRAIPWSQLILQDGSLPNDLNLQTGQKISTASVFGGMASLFLSLFRLWSLLLALIAITVLWWLNRDFYRFLRQKRSLTFMLMAMPWHWFYFLYSGLSFIYVLLFQWLGHKTKRMLTGPRPSAATFNRRKFKSS